MYKKWYGHYKLEHEKISAIVNEELQKNIKTPTQKESWIEWSKLKKLVTSWRRKNRKKPTEKGMLLAVLSALYLSSNYLPPRRNIYRSFKFYSRDKPNPMNIIDNYYWNGNLYFNDTKSGQQNFKLKKESMKITRLIEEYHSKYNDSEWLLRDPKTKQPLTDDKYKSLVREMTSPAFDKNHPGIGVRMLRTIFVTEVANKIQDSNLRKMISYRMGHSINVATQYYDKPYDNEKQSIQMKITQMK
tara:strand:+ start:2065 stop:2796 length:732 start_codon:yes stop_codon:yes gene_type:complete